MIISISLMLSEFKQWSCAYWTLSSNINIGKFSKCFFLISMKLTWWPIFGEVCPWMDHGWGEIPQYLFCKLIIVAEIPRAAEIFENLLYMHDVHTIFK